MTIWKQVAPVALSALLLAACGGGGEVEDKPSERFAVNPDPFPSTYAPYGSETTLIRNATVLDGVGGMIEGGGRNIRNVEPEDMI